MSNATGISRVAAALAMDAERGAAHYAAAGPSTGAWQQDYGRTRRPPDVGASRLHDGWGWDSDGDRSPQRKGGLDDSHSRSRETLWRRVTSSLCPGTMVFVVCVAITAFIVVV